MSPSRREFLKLAAMASAAAGAGSGARADDAGSASRSETPVITMLWGDPRFDTDLEAWFSCMKRWGVRRWMSYGLVFRNRFGHPNIPWSNGVPFLEDAWPGFRDHVDVAALAPQEALYRKEQDLCAAHGIEFWSLVPFPLFPTTDEQVLRRVAPYFLRPEPGRVNLYEPRLAEILKAEMRELKKALPGLKGITLLLAEGAGTMGNLTVEDLEHNREWERPLIAAFDEVTKELGISGMVSGHHFLLTVAGHRAVYEMMSEFPDLIAMDDVTWPEEDMLHPFLGYLPEADRKLMFRNNPVALKVLIDTEYIGEGVLPGAYARWWKYCAGETVRSGARMAIGRTFFWDAGYTDVNFNRLNAYAFIRFCRDPEADARQVLGEAVREMFGERIPERLIDILWESEPVIKSIVGVNGIDCLDHSRFPKTEDLDRRYIRGGNTMKAIDDLFSPPGTPLYPPLTDGLNNVKQWRWQDRTVAEPAQTYLAAKRGAAAWVHGILPEVRDLAAGLPPRHRDMFLRGYAILDSLAGGMELFVEAAAVHYAWAHAKSIDDRSARERFDALAERFRAAAAAAPENPFEYRERMLAFADFLGKGPPGLRPG